MALLNTKSAVSLAALMAFGLATTPGGTLRLSDRQTIEMPAIGSAAAATKKKTTKKAPPKKPATTKRVCTTKKVKGKLVKSCKTVKIVPAPVVVVPPPVVVTTVAPAPVQPVAVAPQPPLPAPPPPPAPQPYQPRASDYFPIHLADSLAGAVGDAPPDFVVRFDRIDSWVWLSRSGEMLIVEPGRQGVVQYYFMNGGNAPYLVRDAYNSYAFNGPELTHVYDDRGRLFIGQLSWSQADESRAMFDRGRALFAASLRQRGWSGDSAVRWYDTMRGSSGWSYQHGWRGNWGGDWRRRSDWQSFEYDQFSQMPPRYLDDERRRRQDSTWRYDRWRRDGAQGAPPPTANPVIQNPAPVSTAETSPPAPAPRPRPAPAPAPAPMPTPAPTPAPRPAWRQPAPQQPTITQEPQPNEFPRRRPAPQPAPPPPPPPVQVQQVPVVAEPAPPPPPPPPLAPPVEVAPPPPPPAPPPPPPPPAPPVEVAPPPPPPPPPPTAPVAVPEPVLEQPAPRDVPIKVDEGVAQQDTAEQQRP